MQFFGQAQAAPASEGTARASSPWSRGVSPQRQALALRLFGGGNALLQEGQCVQALDRYRRALAAWDHPAIHFNRVICLVRLRRYEAAYESLRRALRYGKAALGAKYAMALSYRALLRSNLAVITVICDQPAVRVSLDGRLLFTGPGRAVRRVKPGRHVVLARRSGHVSDIRKLDLRAGRARTVRLRPVAITSKVRLQRRWRRWMPWVVLGAGVLMAATGAPLTVGSERAWKRYDAEIDRVCRSLPAGGCTADQLSSRARTLDRQARIMAGAGVAMYVVGGVLMTLGGVFAVLNRPRAVEKPSGRGLASWLLPAPAVSPRGLMLTWKGRF